MRYFQIALFLLFKSFLFSSGAIADDDQKAQELSFEPYIKDGWRIATVRISAINGYTGENTFENGGFVLYTAATDTLGVIFHCQNGKVQAGVSLKEINLRNVIAPRGYPQERVIHLKIGDKSSVREKWIYFGRDKIVTPKDPVVSRKIYNALVNDLSLELLMRGRTYFIDPPAPTVTLFNQFIQDCNLSRKS
ncbi:MAG: hypothetical protein AAGD92_15880 [Pseudomonadota bacterium]